MSSPINIPNNTKERTISEEFMARSENSKEIILGFTDGQKPTTNSTKQYESPRRRVDSIEFSPVTESLLRFHGINKIPCSLINKIDKTKINPTNK